MVKFLFLNIGNFYCFVKWGRLVKIRQQGSGILKHEEE
jgi:hypothetical protein